MPRKLKPQDQLAIGPSDEQDCCCMIQASAETKVVQLHLSPEAARALGDRLIAYADNHESRENYN